MKAEGSPKTRNQNIQMCLHGSGKDMELKKTKAKPLVLQT